MVRPAHIAVLVIACWCAAARITHGADATEFIRLAYPNADLTDLLRFYSSVTQRKIWVELGFDLHQKVSVETRRPVPRAEALSVLRGALLEKSIEIRDSGETEAFVSRVRDPVMQSVLPAPSPTATPRIRNLPPRPSLSATLTI